MNQHFASLVETQLLQKFGMHHSHVQLPAQAMADDAWGHRAGQLVRVKPGPLDEAAYGLKSTAADMLRFVQAQINPSGLEAPLRRAARLRLGAVC